MLFMAMGRKVFVFRFPKFSFLALLGPFSLFLLFFSSLSLYWSKATPFDLQTTVFYIFLNFLTIFFLWGGGCMKIENERKPETKAIRWVYFDESVKRDDLASRLHTH